MNDKPDISALLPDDATVRARREALVAELRPQRRRRRPRPAGRRLIVAAVALVAVSGGVAWAAGAFTADDVSLEAGIGCYSQPRLHGNNLAVAGTHSSADPVAKCAKYWREGAIGGGGPSSPHLVACTEQGGGVSVFPGPDDLCARLGLEALPADFAPAGREAGRAYTAWFKFLMDKATVPPGDCRSPQVIAQQVRARLAKTSYSDVKVVIRKEGPCARMVDAEGVAIEVFTGSRSEDRQQQLGARAASALGPLGDKASKSCIAPASFEAQARRALAKAELSEVKVHVYRPYEPCVGGGFGYDPKNTLASFDADPREVWQANKTGEWRKAEGMRLRKTFEEDRERYERLHGSG